MMFISSHGQCGVKVASRRDETLQMRVVIGTDDPEVARLDDGAFLEWLQRQDEEQEPGTSSGALASLHPRVAVIGHDFKPIPANLEPPELPSSAKPVAAVKQVATSAIATPSYVNIQSTSAQGTFAKS